MSAEMRGEAKASGPAAGPSRGRRLIAGWSANLVQMILGVTQQVLLVPVFLHFWTSDVLAAWLALYAAGNLVVVADSGLHFRAINRFFAFKSSVDRDGRTGRFYAQMLWVYWGLSGALGLLLVIFEQIAVPSKILGFEAVPYFDAAFLVMTLGVLLTLPSNLPSSLYRVGGHYGRVVWIQNGAMALAQLAQLVVVGVTGSLLAVTIAYVGPLLLMVAYLLAIDAPRLFPCIRQRASAPSWRWTFGQFGLGFPFAMAGTAEVALLNAPVLLVSALVPERIAVAQWGLTRVIAGLLRMLCAQATQPIAAELGHDYVTGQKDLLRALYARGSALVTLLASGVAAALLSFWQDFFEIWTRGSVPYDPVLTVVLLLGATLVAPSLLALGFANYSNRGPLLLWTKSIQLAILLVLSVILIPRLGPLGAAIALVSSDVVAQAGILSFMILPEILRHPLRHVSALLAIMVATMAAGTALGGAIGYLVPGTGILHFLIECSAWLVAAVLVISPLARKPFRERLLAKLPV
jgi:O-antigen/teichoic acid export membrane protein